MVTHRFSFRIDAPGHDLHDEETIIRAENQTKARELATERAVAWKVDLQFVGVRVGPVSASRLEVQIPLEQLPESWRDEVAA